MRQANNVNNNKNNNKKKTNVNHIKTTSNKNKKGTPSPSTQAIRAEVRRALVDTAIAKLPGINGAVNKVAKKKRRKNKKKMNKGGMAIPRKIGNSAFRTTHQVKSFKHKDYGDAVRISGKSYLQDLNVQINPATGASFLHRGQTILDIRLHPDGLQVGVLSTYASMYNYWRVRNLKFIYNSELSTDTAGAYLLAATSDPNDLPVEYGTQNLEYATLRGAIKKDFYQHGFVEWKPGKLEKQAKLIRPDGSGDLSVTDFGRIFMFTMGDIRTSFFDAGYAIIGTVDVEYDIEFYELDLKTQRENMDQVSMSNLWAGIGSNVLKDLDTDAEKKVFGSKGGDIQETFIEQTAAMPAALVSAGIEVGSTIVNMVVEDYAEENAIATALVFGLNILGVLAGVFLKNMSATNVPQGTPDVLICRESKVNDDRIKEAITALIAMKKRVVRYHEDKLIAALEDFKSTNAAVFVAYLEFLKNDTTQNEHMNHPRNVLNHFGQQHPDDDDIQTSDDEEEQKPEVRVMTPNKVSLFRKK